MMSWLMVTLVHQSPPLNKPQDIFALLLSSPYLLLKGVDNEGAVVSPVFVSESVSIAIMLLAVT